MRKLTILVAMLFATAMLFGCQEEAPKTVETAKKVEAAKPAEQAKAAEPKKKDPLAAWKVKFDPSGAEYTYILSNISHPVIEGVGAGYRIRDRVWEESNGRLYVDFRPLAQLGGEKDVINKLKLGAVHGMMSSSVAAQNVADTLGIVNMPYVVDTFDKLDKFRNTPELWQPCSDSALKSGIMTVDVTGYGPYGWATFTWDQRDASGQPVPPGDYRVEITFDVGPKKSYPLVIGGKPLFADEALES